MILLFQEMGECIFKGSSLFGETSLPDVPCAVTTIYSDSNEPKIPGVAVACGSQVLVYRNARPYFKFSLPMLNCDDEEISNIENDIWRQKCDSKQLVHLLRELSIEHGFSKLSSSSQQLLTLKDEHQDDFIKLNSHIPIKKQMIITNMTKIPKSLDTEKSVECLIVTTESAHLFVLDPECFTVVNQCKLPGITSHICAEGIYSVEFNIIFATRNGGVYKLKRGFEKAVCLTNLSSLPVDLALDLNRFLTINMDETLQSFTQKGHREWTISLRGAPVAFYVLPSHIVECTVAVACNVFKKGNAEGVVYIYKGTEILHSLFVQGPIQAFIYGSYGYGEQAFIFNIVGGGLSIKLLKRTANFGAGDKCASLASSLSHNVKLLIPKKSKIFVEQTLRERECSKEIYTWFQKTWIGMKVISGESYLNALDVSAINEDNSLKFTAQVLGLGPRLKILIQLQNINKDKLLTNLAVTFIYDINVYTFESPYLTVPILIPNFEYCMESFVTCRTNISSTIKMLIVSEDKVITSAVINMPPAMVETST